MKRRLLSLTSTAILLLSACTVKEAPHSAAPSDAPQKSHETRSPALPEATFPLRPPFRTVLIDGAELCQGRFKQPEAQGGTLIRSIIGSNPKTFNPWTATDTESREMSGHMFRGLTNIDYYTGEIIPDMAAEVTASPDKVTYITRLRKGLKWSDGAPITAADVAFTWNTIIAKGYGNSSFRDIVSIDGKPPVVTVVDELTNKFVTAKPFVPFTSLLGIPLAPKHVVEKIIRAKDGRKKFDNLWSQDTDPKTLVTSGPFTLERYVPGERVEFKRASNFYMIDQNQQKLPKLDRLIYTFVSDVTVNRMKFEQKDIDITQIRPRDAVKFLKEQEKGNFKLYNLGQSYGTYFLTFNLNKRLDPSNHKPYVDPIKSKWFNNTNFRQAINHALNREQMVANYFKGIGFSAFWSLPPASPFFNKTLPEFKQDLNYAIDLLSQAGFKKQEDGYLYDQEGNKVEFDILATAGGTMNEAIAGMVTDDLKKLGIKVNYQQLEFNALVDRVNNKLDWQALLFGLSGDPLEPNDAGNVFRSDGRLHLFDQRLPNSAGIIEVNDTRPWEKRLDEIFNQGVSEFDKEKRLALYNEFQKIIYDECPFIYLVNPMVIIAARNTIGNFEPTPLSQSQSGLHNLEEIHMKPLNGQ